MHELTSPTQVKMYNRELSKSLKLIKETKEERIETRDLMQEIRDEDQTLGRAEGKAEMVRELIRTGKLSLEIIAQINGLPEELKKMKDSPLKTV